jgi:putative Flp pilus-assembly TadE/G-like protein
LLVGFIRLALDVGMPYRSRQNVQIGADAAATALDYIYNGSTSPAQTAS